MVMVHFHAGKWTEIKQTEHNENISSNQQWLCSNLETDVNQELQFD